MLSWPCNAGDEVMFTIICVTSRSSHRHNVINDCAYTGTRTYQVRYTWYLVYEVYTRQPVLVLTGIAKLSVFESGSILYRHKLQRGARIPRSRKHPPA